MEILNGYVTFDLGVEEIKMTSQKVEDIHARFVELIKLKKPIMIPPVRIGDNYFGVQFIIPKYITLTDAIYFDINPICRASELNSSSTIRNVVRVTTDDNIYYVGVRYAEQA